MFAFRERGAGIRRVHYFVGAVAIGTPRGPAVAESLNPCRDRFRK